MTDEKLAAERAAFIATFKPIKPLWQFLDDGTGGFTNELTEWAWIGWRSRAFRPVCTACKGSGWVNAWVADETDRSGQSDRKEDVTCPECDGTDRPDSTKAKHASLNLDATFAEPPGVGEVPRG